MRRQRIETDDDCSCRPKRDAFSTWVFVWRFGRVNEDNTRPKRFRASDGGRRGRKGGGGGLRFSIRETGGGGSGTVEVVVPRWRWFGII